MATAFIASLNLITRQLAIYYTIPVGILGVFGGFMNIIVFLSLKTFRETSCVFYLIIMSTFDLVRLFFNVWPYVMRYGFNIDLGLSSLFFCKIRYAMFSSSTLISMTCFCLATMDQYFATCSRPRWQRWCHTKLAHHLTAIFMIIWTAHSIPYLVFYSHIILPETNRTICQSTNQIFANYLLYGYYLSITNIIPLITFIFGLMAYHNARTLAHRTVPLVRRELDKQLTVMVLAQVFINSCIFLPYSVMCIFGSINSTATDLVFLAKVNLTSVAAADMVLITFVSPFYTYVCASKRFRRQVVYVLCKMHFNQYQPNEIAPIQVIS